VTIDYKVTDRGDPDNCTGAPGASCDAPKDSATITVTPVNDAPTVAVAEGGACGTNDRSGTINLTVNDPDGQAQTASLKLSPTSNNKTLVPASNVIFGGSGASRTLTATTVSGKTGTATITVTVSDGTATGTTVLTLLAGGNANDTLTGTSQTTTVSGTDILLGQNGDDTLRGVGGKDLLCGARGNDRLSGGTEADSFSGGAGTDTATDFKAAEGDTKDATIPWRETGGTSDVKPTTQKRRRLRDGALRKR
jgi:Ca2+-binding RTX toxin-like protein